MWYDKSHIHHKIVAGNICCKKKKSVTCVCVNLEKAFDRVSHQVLWWAMRKLEVDERIIQLVHLSEM